MLLLAVNGGNAVIDTVVNLMHVICCLQIEATEWAWDEHLMAGLEINQLISDSERPVWIRQ